MKNTYKDNKILIMYFFDSFNHIKSSMIFKTYFNSDFELALELIYPEIYFKINYILDDMDRDHSRIIINDFIKKNNNYWWKSYYSKSTYYKIKGNAMEEFVNRIKMC